MRILEILVGDEIIINLSRGEKNMSFEYLHFSVKLLRIFPSACIRSGRSEGTEFVLVLKPGASATLKV